MPGVIVLPRGFNAKIYPAVNVKTSDKMSQKQCLSCEGGKDSDLSTGVGQTAKIWLSEKCYLVFVLV